MLELMNVPMKIRGPCQGPNLILRAIQNVDIILKTNFYFFLQKGGFGLAE